MNVREHATGNTREEEEARTFDSLDFGLGASV